MAVGSYFPGRGTIVEESFLKGEAKGLEKGRAEERALRVLRVLDNRQVGTTASVRARITGCADLDTLDRWFDRAFTVSDVNELFANE